MNSSTIERQKLMEAVIDLPDEALVELASFIDYLHYKSSQPKQPEPSPNSFLLKIAGLGSSGQQDISERDEEILRNEIDPIHGWSSKRD